MPVQHLTLIVAYAQQRVMGLNNSIPWHIVGEQAHFKRVTLGHPIVMGRKTWESLPRRPLPGRLNIVVTRNAQYHADGAQVAHSLEAALALCADATEVFVIGGAELYALALPRATHVIATEIDAAIAGDTYFPALDAHWRETSRVPGPTDAGQLPHAFVTYQHEFN